MHNITTRALCEIDVDCLHDICSQWIVVRQLGGWPWPADRQFTASRCVPYAGTGFVWGLVRENRVIGTMAVTNTELGYCLHPDYWGQGIIHHFGALAVEKAFADYPWDQLTAATWADNARSGQVLRKLGFTHWHTAYERAKARRVPTLSADWHLTRDAWQRLRTAPV